MRGIQGIVLALQSCRDNACESAKDRAVRIKFTNYLPTGEGGDLFLIFAAANVVATTLQTGAVLGLRYGAPSAPLASSASSAALPGSASSVAVMALVVGGALLGAVLVALLARLEVLGPGAQVRLAESARGVVDRERDDGHP